MYGITISNDTTTTIDSNYTNFGLREKRRKLAGTDFKAPGEIYAVKPDKSTTTTTNIVTPNGFPSLNYGNSTVYIFDASTNITDSKFPYGIEINGDANKVSTDFKYMKVLASSKNNNAVKTPLREWWNPVTGVLLNGFSHTMNFGHSDIAVLFLDNYALYDDDYWYDWYIIHILSTCCIMPNNDVVIEDYRLFEITKYGGDIPRWERRQECEWLILDVSGM